MRYIDSDRCPKTWEDYEAEARERALERVTGTHARALLRAVGARGYSKLSADEARKEAARHGEEWAELVESLTVRYRWLVAHGLELAYEELATLEARAGVEVVDNGTRRGGYASAGDVRAVYDAFGSGGLGGHAIRVRLSCGDEADRSAAREVMAALAERYELTDATEYDARDGSGANLYMSVFVPD